jgi:hypothetical protein
MKTFSAPMAPDRTRRLDGDGMIHYDGSGDGCKEKDASFREPQDFISPRP